VPNQPWSKNRGVRSVRNLFNGYASEQEDVKMFFRGQNICRSKDTGIRVPDLLGMP
jgi:hypothetical protein